MSTQGVTITVNAESGAAADQLQRFFSSTVEGFDHLSRASEFLQELAGRIIAGLSVAAVVEFTREAINAAAAIGTLSRQVGFSLQSLAALKSQANTNGIQFEELRLGLTHFNDVLNQARQHGGGVMQTLRNLNHEIAVAVAEGKPAEVVYRMIAERFKAMPDGIQKTAAAQALFGRESGKWVTLLNEGAAGMEKIKELNGGITPEAVAQASAFNRSLRELHERLELVFLNLATQILPTLQQMVNWLKQFTDQTNAAGNASAGLVDVFKGLVTAAVVLGAVFADIGKLIGYSVQGWVEVFVTAYDVIKGIVAQIKILYQDLVNLAASTVDTFISAQQAMLLAATGHFDEARKLMSAQLGGIKDDATALSAHLATTFNDASKKIAKTVGDLGENLGNMLGDFYAQWSGLSDFIGALWQKAPGGKAAGASSGSQIPAGAGAGSDATTDPAKLASTKLQLTREQIELNKKVIETDPTLTQSERLQKLLPLQIQEAANLQAQIANQKAIGSDSTRTEDERVAANREMVRLQLQQLQLSRQMVEAVHPWQTAFAGAVQHLKEMNNLAKESAQAFENITNTAITSISDGLTGLIEGTKSWSQALRDVGSAILHEIISAIVTMAVRWLITSLMMAAFGEALIASTSALYASAWAGPAILATTATFGAAAAAAPPEVMGALAFAPAISALSIAAREHGGDVRAGFPYMMGERGREIVVPSADARVFNADDTARLVNLARTSAAPSRDNASPVNLMMHYTDDHSAVLKKIRENPEYHHAIADVNKRTLHFIQRTA